ncbi:MAG: hypothetical protein KKC05_01955 [Nanoarchaeota archaeon]|nr:hypothetical protein [Nanoarchaeota archaeon]
MKVNEEKIILWSEAKKILSSLEKEKTLGYEQKNALEQLKKFSKLTQKEIDELTSKLEKMDKLKGKHLTSVINILPKDQDEVKLLFAHEPVNLSEEDRKKIASITKAFG